MNHQNFTSAYRYLPANQNSNQDQINPNSNSNSQFNHHLSSHSLFQSSFTDHLDPPPPYSLISPTPPYSLYPDLIITEIFRSLFHFPDFHPLLINSFPLIPSQYPDSSLSHLIAFPPRYESRSQLVQSDTECSYISIIICIRERHTSERIHRLRSRRFSQYTT